VPSNLVAKITVDEQMVLPKLNITIGYVLFRINGSQVSHDDADLVPLEFYHVGPRSLETHYSGY
jgi:hypothetical protein